MTLAVGQTYTVDGYYGGNGFAIAPSSQATAPQITYVSPVINEGATGLADATASDSFYGTTSGYFGGSFKFTPAASPAPEPSQVGMLAMMGLGLGGIILRARNGRMRNPLPGSLPPR